MRTMGIRMLTICVAGMILVQPDTVSEEGTRRCSDYALGTVDDVTSVLQVSAVTNTTPNRLQTQASQDHTVLKQIQLVQASQVHNETLQKGESKKMSQRNQASLNHRTQNHLVERIRSMMSPAVISFVLVWSFMAIFALGAYAISNFFEPHEQSAKPHVGAPAVSNFFEPHEQSANRKEADREESDEPPIVSPTRRSSSADKTIPRSRQGSLARPFRRSKTITMAEIEMEAKEWNSEDAIGTLTGGAFVVTMVCDLGPNGIIPLPHGLVKTGLMPGIMLVFAFYGCCVCTMWMVGKVAFITGKVSFAEQWTHLIGPNTAWVPLAVLAVNCFGNNIEYLCFVADLMKGALPAFGIHMSRTYCVWLFALFPTLPLCFKKDLSALAPTSLLSLVSVFYLVVAMCVRCFDGSYKPGGSFFKELPPDARPDPPQSHMFQIGVPSLVLVNALAMAFLPHYNGCKYYRELYMHTPTRFLKRCAQGMGCVAMLYIVAMLVGYQTFGPKTRAVITNNYAEDDLLISIARICIGLSILFSFPLMFSGLREACLQMLKEVAQVDCQQVWKQDVFSMIMVVVIGCLTTVLTDSGKVVGLVGAVCGISCIFILPCTLYAAALSADVATNPPSRLRMTYALMALGVILMIGGVYATFCL